MAIGTTAALLGSAVIGAGASAIGASKNKKAINKATDAQTAANQQSIALQRDIYNQNLGILNPFVQRGNVAGDSINALLGLPSAPQAAQTPPISPGQPASQAGVRPQGGLAQYGPFVGDANGDLAGLAGMYAPQAQITQGGTPMAQPAGPQVTPQTAQSAFQNYLGSTGYQFRVGEGQRALNSGFAGKGLLDSGAARKGITEFGQNIASDEFGRYLGYLGNQQGVGLSGGSALAGVGQNYAGNITALNQQQGQNIANSAIARASNSNALLGSLAGIGGNVLGGLGSSYGR